MLLLEAPYSFTHHLLLTIMKKTWGKNLKISKKNLENIQTTFGKQT